MPLVIKLLNHEIIVSLDSVPTITTDLNDGNDNKSSDHFAASIDGIESLILAHAVNGIDITCPAYVRGIQTAIESGGNHLL
jgi:hypothetical protein